MMHGLDLDILASFNVPYKNKSDLFLSPVSHSMTRPLGVFSGIFHAADSNVLSYHSKNAIMCAVVGEIA